MESTKLPSKYIITTDAGKRLLDLMFERGIGDRSEMIAAIEEEAYLRGYEAGKDEMNEAWSDHPEWSSG